MKNRSSIFLSALIIVAITITLAVRVGPLGAVALTFSFGLVGFFSVWGIITLVMPERTLGERNLFSLLVAPLFFALSAWFSGITGNFTLRLIPPIIGLAVSVAVIVWRKKHLPANPPQSNLKPLYLGWLIGFLALIPALLVTLSSQKIATGVDLNLYNDVPWQTAMVSEALDRAPQFFPFLDGVPLAYPWLFHGFLGNLGSFTGLTAATLFTAVWPIIYACLLPLAVSFFAWRLTKNFWVTTLATVALVFFVGPAFPGGESLRFPLTYSISPTYEFGILSLLIFFIFLTYKQPAQRWGKLASLSLAFLTVFVASGSKGSNGLIVVVVMIAYFIQESIFKKNWRYPLLQSVIAAIAAVTAYTLTISGSSGDLTVDPLSFLPNLDSLSAPVLFIVASLAWLAGSAFVIRRFTPITSPAFFPSLFGAIAGILFMATFGHPGLSQMYFYWSIVPVLVLFGLWAIVLLFVEFGAMMLIPLISAWIFAQLLDAHVSYFFDPTDYAKIKWPVIWVLNSIVFVLVLSLSQKLPGYKKVAVLTISAACVFSLAAQPFGSVRQVHSGPRAQAGVEIFADQFETFDYVRDTTSPDVVIATNRHCLAPTAEVAGCDNRYVALSAFSERRAFIEGHYKTSDQSLMNRLSLNDTFIYNPDASIQKQLWEQGVRYIYIDKTVAPAGDLQPYAVLIRDTEHSQLWELNQP